LSWLLFPLSQELLKCISTTLKDAVWNSVEKPVYYLTAKTVLETLCPLVCFSHLEGNQVRSRLALVSDPYQPQCGLLSVSHRLYWRRCVSWTRVLEEK